jgi:hypothetical protein
VGSDPTSTTTALSLKAITKAPLYIFDSSALVSSSLRNDVNGSALLDMLLQTPRVPEELDAKGTTAVEVHHRMVLSQFSLGPPLSGAQPHFHGHAVNALVHGIKLWLLFPPALAFFSEMTAIEFFSMLVDKGADRDASLRDAALWWSSIVAHQDGLSSSMNHQDTARVMWVIQRSGDVVYVPEFWGHSVLNLVDSVGAAFEFVVSQITKSTDK